MVQMAGGVRSVVDVCVYHAHRTTMRNGVVQTCRVNIPNEEYSTSFRLSKAGPMCEPSRAHGRGRCELAAWMVGWFSPGCRSTRTVVRTYIPIHIYAHRPRKFHAFTTIATSRKHTTHLHTARSSQCAVHVVPPVRHVVQGLDARNPSVLHDSRRASTQITRNSRGDQARKASQVVSSLRWRGG